MPEQADRRDRAFVLAVIAYFAAQAALRTLLGGALEVDEAEMVLLADGWRLGYGPQLPLYNWLQVAAFELFGVTTLALTGLKNAVLCLAYLLLFAGLRRVVPFGQAVAGTLALALLPNILWEFQRASTHSIALLAAMTGTIALFLQALRAGSWPAHLLLGLALGLGGLAKFNYWLMPVALLAAALSIRDLRAGLRPMRLLAATGVAVAIVAWPYLWIVRHPSLGLASASKLYRPDTALPAFVEGVAEAAGGAALGLLIPATVAIAFRLGRAGRTAGPTPWPARLLLRAGAVAFGLTLAGIVAGNVSDIHPRWLVPVFCLVAPGLTIAAAHGATPVGTRRLAGFAGLLCVLTLAGMAELRLNGRATGSIDFRPLAEAIAPLTADGTPVITEYHLGGNLRFLIPDLSVIVPLQTDRPTKSPDRAVVVWAQADTTEASPNAAAILTALGYAEVAASARVVGKGEVKLPYRYAPHQTFPVRFLAVELGNVPD